MTLWFRLQNACQRWRLLFRNCRHHSLMNEYSAGKHVTQVLCINDNRAGIAWRFDYHGSRTKLNLPYRLNAMTISLYALTRGALRLAQAN